MVHSHLTLPNMGWVVQSTLVDKLSDRNRVVSFGEVLWNTLIFAAI